MTYFLGEGSKDNLKGVDPKLVEMVEECIKITPVDFTILNNGGLRTASMQMKLFKRGASKLDGRNRKSKHQKQPSGFGEAVDLVPYVGSPRWEWPLIYPIAGCMAWLSREMNVEIRWGGVWDKELDEYAPKSLSSPEQYADAIEKAVRAYTIRHPGPDFIDGPHYEMLH
jgi:peptidoglycan L-alanyl-D-glutamate endopeptidase CwlK